MFICNCNALNEKQVRAAIDAGAKTWHDVHEHHGCSPQCGGCGPEISELLHPRKEESFATARQPALASS